MLRKQDLANERRSARKREFETLLILQAILLRIFIGEKDTQLIFFI